MTSHDEPSVQLNLSRSMKLLDAASGSKPSPFRTSFTGVGSPSRSARLSRSVFNHSQLESPRLSSTTRRVPIASPGRGSFYQSPADLSLTFEGGEQDHTINLLGGKTFNPLLDVTLSGDATTNVSLLLEDKTANLESSEIFEHFEEIFRRNSAPSQVFDMMQAYSTVLSTITNISKSLIKGTTASRHRISGLLQLHTNLRSEMWTWQLAASLLKDIVDMELRPDEEMMEDEEQTVMTNRQLMEQFFSDNEKVRRCQIVVDWLEMMNSEDVLDDFYNKVQYFSEKSSVMWENTLHLKKSSSKKAEILVEYLDPDAPHRTGQRLASLDQEDDDRLVRYVFALLRAGKLEEAHQLCVRCGQSWRAATLEGWKLSHDPNFTSDVDEQLDSTGNQFRDVWKSTCWSLSQEDSCSTYEKAIYASLSGNLEQVLAVCDNWTDALWAHLKVLVDIELEQHMRLHTSSADHQLVELPAAYWAKTTNVNQLFKELEASQKESVRDQCQRFFHKIQKHLITGDYDALVEVMVDAQRGNTLSPHILRFMAHFVLFLRSMDKVAVEESVCELVEGYMRYLMDSKQYKLVATYCAVLPRESQLITYGLFLESVKEKDDRLMVLTLGKQAGLDMSTITRIVTENSLVKLKNLIDIHASGNEVISVENRPQVDSIIDSLEWLLIDPEQIMDCIHQCNAQMRVFLAIKDHQRLKEVYSKLPADCIGRALAGKEDMQLMDDSNAIKECICFRTYLEALQAFDDWFTHLHQAPTKPANNASRHFAESVTLEHKMKQYEHDLQRWQNALIASTEHTIDQLKAVLLFAGGWMEDMSEGESEDPNYLARQEQLTRLRQLCIPEVVSLLHKILDETQRKDELKQLIDIIQSENYQLYKAFTPNDLKRILHSLEESVSGKE
ncbi:nuclear pore complex protein Nup107-like [Watersipora subatra]|uniref:nuclear pore complex protein Nup107-like n=1 Tax=Watersipora subatra TaxID=2589382 RepID=UPI00355C2250